MTSLSDRWEIPPDAQHIGAVRREVASFAERVGLADTALADVRVAVSDALTSAILHADADREAGSVSVQAQQVGDELVVRVCDAGSCIAEQPICPVLGPRLSMIAALAQVFGVRRCAGGATELRMHFTLGGR